MSEYFIIDFGVNFANNTRYPDEKIKSIMDDSWNDGVEKVVCISNSMKESKRIIQMKDKFVNMHYTLGVHPLK
jgi:Tat protein secretion system quality control protein TatD with DNase activity